MAEIFSRYDMAKSHCTELREPAAFKTIARHKTDETYARTAEMIYYLSYRENISAIIQ